MYSDVDCLLFMQRRNIHYYIKITIREDWRVVTPWEGAAIASPSRTVAQGLTIHRAGIVTVSCIPPSWVLEG